MYLPPFLSLLFYFLPLFMLLFLSFLALYIFITECFSYEVMFNLILLITSTFAAWHCLFSIICELLPRVTFLLLSIIYLSIVASPKCLLDCWLIWYIKFMFLTFTSSMLTSVLFFSWYTDQIMEKSLEFIFLVCTLLTSSMKHPMQ